MNKKASKGVVLFFTALLLGCSGESNIIVSSLESDQLSTELQQAITAKSNGDGLDWLRLPASDNLASIPQDPQNPLTKEKVMLGRFLFHDTALATKGQSSDSESWSCASCHHAAAGFKAGVPQGIGEGGVGFGTDGSARHLSDSFDAMAESDAANKPDIQPVASPTILNSAYQEVMLWNGQFGNAADGVNQGLPMGVLATPDTPKKENVRGFSGLETQAIAGLDVHRLDVSAESDVHTNSTYQQLFAAAYPSGSSDIHMDAAKAIAAYERTVLANASPFQKWLNGDTNAMTQAQLRGGILFFGKAGCADCHRGPALSSEPGADENQMFMAIGFNDFDTDGHVQIHGPIGEADRQGRGGFTKEPADMYKFKIPQLYNLSDTTVFGHGASFTSIRDVLEYKNAAAAQNNESLMYIDERFVPLQLSPEELDDLEVFLAQSLHDDKLLRYQPGYVPSGECLIVDPKSIDTHGLCP